MIAFILIFFILYIICFEQAVPKESKRIHNVLSVSIMTICFIGIVAYLYYGYYKKQEIERNLKVYFLEAINTYDNPKDVENILNQYINNNKYLLKIEDSNLDKIEEDTSSEFFVTVLSNDNLYLDSIKITVSRDKNQYKYL